MALGMRSAGLPQELLQFAENFYRRFPEEFLALGAPGLEDNFDLRPNGTWNRQILDTPSEKSVEITIRRWQHPPPPFAGPLGHPYYPASYPPPQANPYSHSPMAASGQHLAAIGVLQQQASGLSASSTATGPPPPYGYPAPNPHGYPAPNPPFYGAPSMFGPSPVATVPTHSAQPRSEAETAAEAKLTSRLSQLETVLTQLKPQIEGILSGQQQFALSAQAHSHPRATIEAYRASRGAGSSADTPAQPFQDIEGKLERAQSCDNIGPDGKELRNRRGVGTLAIQTAPKEKVPEKLVSEPVPKPIVSPHQNQNPAQRAQQYCVREASQEETVVNRATMTNSIDRIRPQTIINPIRVASGHQDPNSPRSPGRFSAWK